jgi:peptide/nickel transport system permease protein
VSTVDPGFPVAGEVPLPTPGPTRTRSDRMDTLRRIFQSKTFIAGLIVLLFWTCAAIFGEHLTKSAYDSSTDTLQGMSSSHWFGTDTLGRDVFARVIAGSREIMIVAIFSTILGVIGGTVVGLITGYFSGTIDNSVSRVADSILAIPLIISAVTVVTALGGVSNVTLILVIGAIFTPLIGRTVRTAVLVERGLDYVQAAKLRGERAPYIMFVEILPNVTAPILVEGTVRLGYSIFFISSLSFLGFGIEPPSPDWGAQVAANYTLISFAWWTVLFPSLAIASLVISINLITDGITHVVEG